MAGVDLNIGSEQAQVYKELFELADKDKDSLVGPSDAEIFLSKSCLAPETLEQIWDLSDYEGNGYLSEHAFYLCLRLIAIAQTDSDAELSVEAAANATSLPNPNFAGATPRASVIAANDPLSNPPAESGGMSSDTFAAEVAERLARDSTASYGDVEVDEPEEEGLVVSVSNPLKQQSGLQTYTVYTVTAESADGQQVAQTIRRFSDFEWLRAQLLKIGGIVVPPLPEKKFFGRFGGDFVDKRRKDLDTFLRDVNAHPELRKNDALKGFLRLQETEFESFKKEFDSGNVKKALSGLKRDALAKMSKDAKDANVPMLDTDALFERVETRVPHHSGIVKVSSAASKTANLYKDLGGEFSEVGASFWEMRAANEALAELDHTIRRFGDCCAMSGSLMERRGNLETSVIESGFKATNARIAAMSDAVQNRKKLRSQYSKAYVDYYLLKKKVERLESQPSKQADMRGGLQQAKEKYESVASNVDNATKSLQVEVEKGLNDNDSAVKDLLMNYAKGQIELCTKMEDLWKGLETHIETGA